MSYEEYAQHMTNKYKLAVAIAVIQNKPENLTNEQYISELKQNLAKIGKNYTDGLVHIDDFNLNDDDFNYDESDDFNVIDEFNQNLNKQDPIFYDNDSLNEEQSNKIDSQTSTIEFLEGPSDIEINEDTTKYVAEKIDDENDTLDDMLKTLRQIDNEKEHYVQTKNATQEYFQIVPNFITHLNTDYAAEAHTNEEVHLINLFESNDTQVIIDDRIRNNIAKNITKICETKQLINETNMEQSITVINDDDSKILNDEETNIYNILNNNIEMEVEVLMNEDSEKDDVVNRDIVAEKHEIDLENKVKQLNNQHAKVEQNAVSSYNESATANMIEMENSTHAEDITDTQNTILYTQQEYSQNYSHISQSQFQNIEIPQMYIHGTKNRNILQSIDKNENFETTKYFSLKKQNQEDNDSDNIKYIIDHTGKTYAVLESYSVNNKTNLETVKLNNNDLQESQKTSESLEIVCEVENKTQSNSKLQATVATQVTDDISKEFDKNVIDDDENFYTRTANSQDIVPFKVVKELSTIKTFLDREARISGFSSDSGYRSDSQSSRKSSRLSYDWVHQSAHCLYNYIVECPLVTVTQEIVNEVSQVLGRLIDRLHEEEKYPAFLEELLEKVDTLMQDLGRDSGDHNLVEKDDIIQRLLLLNKSSHILKFSMDKIVKKLETTHSRLVSKENLYELESIGEIENLQYTFYILESFIQKYIQIKSTASQSTQNSQETKILKRSSISEIWRKKWYPNSGEAKNAGSQKESCVLNKCGDILNRIIVDCMDSYSLVSFAALQCFNLLQN